VYTFRLGTAGSISGQLENHGSDKKRGVLRQPSPKELKTFWALMTAIGHSL